MAQKRRGLGRGLQALIPDTQKENVGASRPSDVFFPDSKEASTAPTRDERVEEAVGEVAETASGDQQEKDLAATLLAPSKRAQGSRSRSRTAASKATNKSASSSRRGGSAAAAKTVKTQTTKQPRVADEDKQVAAEPDSESQRSAIATAGEQEPDGTKAGVSRETGTEASSAGLTHVSSADEENQERAADAGPSQSDQPGESEGEEDLVPVPGASFAEIPVDLIHPNPRQPRQVFDEDEITELAASITQVGLLPRERP